MGLHRFAPQGPPEDRGGARGAGTMATSASGGVGALRQLHRVPTWGERPAHTATYLARDKHLIILEKEPKKQ